MGRETLAALAQVPGRQPTVAKVRAAILNDCAEPVSSPRAPAAGQRSMTRYLPNTFVACPWRCSDDGEPTPELAELHACAAVELL